MKEETTQTPLLLLQNRFLSERFYFLTRYCYLKRHYSELSSPISFINREIKKKNPKEKKRLDQIQPSRPRKIAKKEIQFTTSRTWPYNLFFF